jgi:hypothetical protein
MLRYSQWLLSVLSLCLLAAVGCADDAGSSGSEFVYQNQLFAGSSLMQAAQSGNANEPSFSWPQTGLLHVACAIFDQHIEVQRQQIVNSHRAVWTWHTGLGKGREGNVLFSQGSSVPNGSQPAKTLAPGTYYWAVWAFDDNGDVHVSTIENTLIVE